MENVQNIRVQVFVKHENHYGSQEYLNTITVILTTSRVAQQAEFGWDKLLRDESGNDHKSCCARDFVASVGDIQSIEDVRFCSHPPNMGPPHGWLGTRGKH